jgi:carbon-monoxide dehydrogenase medium subunit
MRSSRPKELSELRHILGRGDTDVRLLAGGTDLVVHLNRNPQEKWHLVDLTGIEELKKIERKGHCLEIGALVTFQELEEIHGNLLRNQISFRRRVSGGFLPDQKQRDDRGNVANGSPPRIFLPCSAP